jgi:hypothetical protein
VLILGFFKKKTNNKQTRELLGLARGEKAWLRREMGIREAP